MNIIIDSCVWVALFNRDDSQHKKAVELFEILDGDIFLPEIVVSEVTGVLQRKIGKSAAVTFLKEVFNTEGVHLLSFSSDIIQLQIDFYTKKSPESLSYVDASLLFFANEYRIVTFDKYLNEALKKESY